MLSLFGEEEKLKSESTNFLTKKTDALKLVKDLKIKTEEANSRLSSITSEIYSIKSDKSNLEKRVSILREKIRNSELQISDFNAKEDEQLTNLVRHIGWEFKQETILLGRSLWRRQESQKLIKGFVILGKSEKRTFARIIPMY